MNKLKPLIYFFIILVLAQQSFAMGAFFHKGWKKEKESQGFSVYTRDEPNSDLVGIKVEGSIQAPLPCTMSALREVESSVEWIPGQIEKTTIKSISDLEAITYSLSDLPWPLSNREMVLHNKLHLDLEKDLLFVISKTVDHPDYMKPADSTVRAVVHYSNIGLRPVNKDRTFIELTVFVDPKGSIPSWVVNFYQQGWPIEFLKALEKRCGETKPKLLPGLKRYMQKLLKDMKLPKNMFKDY